MESEQGQAQGWAASIADGRLDRSWHKIRQTKGASRLEKGGRVSQAVQEWILEEVVPQERFNRFRALRNLKMAWHRYLKVPDILVGIQLYSCPQSQSLAVASLNSSRVFETFLG